MKILHITPSYFPATKYGGPISSIHALNKALHQKAIHINVITTNAGIKRIELNKWLICENIKVKYIKYYGYEHFNFSPKMILELIRLINKYDLVTMSSVWNFTTLIGGLFCIFFKKPYIIFPHGALSEYSIVLKSKFKKRLYFFIIIKYILKLAAKIRYTSKHEFETSILSKVHKNHYVIIPHGLDADDHAINYTFSFPPFNLPKKYILYMGRLHPIKGLDILLESFQKLVIEFDDIYLIIAGLENDYLKSLLKTLINKNTTDKIIFTGFISGELKYNLIKKAKIFIMPSYYENFGMSAIEAMRLKTPIIISNKVGIHHDVCDRHAGLIVDTTSDSLYHGIRYLLNNINLRKEIAENGYRLFKEKYNIDIVADQMIKIFKSIINQNQCLNIIR